jgi:amino acid transporter
MNEVRNPIRTLKSVSITALLTACIMYLLVNVAYFIVVPLDEVKDSRELIAALFFERCFGPTVGKTLLPLAVGLSGAGNVMVVTFALVGCIIPLMGSKLTFSGTIEPRSSTARLSSILEYPRVFETFQCTNGRTARTLHSLSLGYSFATFERGILIHP